MSQSIAIPGYDSTNLVPGVYIAVDGSQANTDKIPQRALIIGQQIVQNGYPPNVPVLAGSADDVSAIAGPGSMLALQVAAYRKVDPDGELWLLPLNDDAVSTKAGGSIGVSGQATANGVIPLYIAGQYMPIPVASGNTGFSLAGLIGVLINQNAQLPLNQPVASTGSGFIGAASLAAKNGGLVGNDIDIRLGYYGAANGEAIPPGLTISVPSTLSTGQQNPTALPTALANCGDMLFDFICCPYTDTASLNAIQAFLDNQSGRWSLTREIFGHAFAAFRGTPAQRTTFGATRNDPHSSIIGFYDSPTPSWEWAAYLTAAAAVSVREDPAQPISRIVIPALPPPVASQDVLGTRKTMLQYGLATYTVEVGQVVIERVVTTYKTDPASGAPDNSFQDVETLFTAMACVRDLRIQLQSKFARKKLVADGTPILGGSNMVTAQIILGTVKAIYRTQAEKYGLTQNPDTFNKQARAVNAGNGQVRLFLPYDFANQLRNILGNMQFVKS